jgi:hypothetical protein
MIESRSEALARWEAEGWLVPACEGCGIFYDSPGMPFDVHAPRHMASGNCQSGGYSHCSCGDCGW